MRTTALGRVDAAGDPSALGAYYLGTSRLCLLPSAKAWGVGQDLRPVTERRSASIACVRVGL